ncbi:MAG TPA: bifunctional DNA-formamidopyrimidine glycosylase/DNA-(apurinic or apyrimidinic site) lyase [Baekduia sp.]|uniref:bifunctional DNA-formamidopyrimidine glycosylase/DNA-(apurinic or apyrimidinic site) lyase n=1 Tax=Baekduia sp. TaxID=2600305 RepID=UPI002D768F49|nr:bifunctional DNA-formamidopyrimidine glycosylase/DNA-(apurinic or apyrimidinic site) lyase [Baekduia sp.]HET6507480.1 bifunctional DNA-formamidopyrimidine glycosylase/DNA-(apurinic or apyrimidinic site) lyase [Baekduia sp.]
MPELPEVETIRRQLAPHVEGRTLARVEILDARWTVARPPEDVVDAVEGRRVERLGRRGKYFIFELTDDVYLLVHLRMTGNLLLDPAPDTPYQRVIFTLDDGQVLRFCDPRRFGTGELALGPDGLAAFFDGKLGVEPLSDDFDGRALRAMAKNRRAPVKAFLLDQRHVAGVGNIYADEALHRAGIHPLRPAGQLTLTQCAALADAVKLVLAAGIDAGGSTIDDFRHPDGVSGAFQNDFLVHLRRGEPCHTCGTTVIKLVAAGRGTYVCESCQPRPRVRRRP